MTYFELKKICKQIDDKRKLIATLRAKGYKTTQNITDMPRANGKSDKVGDTVCTLRYQEEQLERLESVLKECIESIPDTVVKEYIENKIYKKWTWEQISRVTAKRSLTGDCIRKICSRYHW